MITTKDEVADGMYIITQGGASVADGEGGQHVPSGSMLAGAFFGHESLALGEGDPVVRNVTVKATVGAGCTCLVMRKAVFEEHVSRLISVEAPPTTPTPGERASLLGYPCIAWRRARWPAACSVHRV